MDAVLVQRALTLFPAVAAIEPALRAEVLAHHTQLLEIAADQPVFTLGQPCAGFPLLLDGEIRVVRGAPQGRSLELYRLTPGELCVASTAALFGPGALPAHGTTTRDTTLLLLNRSGFARWTAHPSFRDHVFAVLAGRITELMALAEAVAFQRLDQRLASALLGHGGVVQVTHQALADELGTVREIITRLLKRFEGEGWVQLARERIVIANPAALRELAATGSVSAVVGMGVSAVPVEAGA